MANTQAAPEDPVITSPLVIYLAAVNLLAFVVIALRITLSRRRGEPDDDPASGAGLCLLAVFGGGIGMLLALVALKRGHISKHEVAWWVSAIAGILVWALACAVWLGLIQVTVDVHNLVAAPNQSVLVPLGIYLAVVNVVTLAAFLIDKIRSMSRGHDGRIPEFALLMLSLAGGALGGTVAMRLGRHKTKKWYFAWGLPAMLVLHVALIVFARLVGVL